MNLGNLAEVINQLIESGISKETRVFVPKEEENQITHTEADVVLMSLNEEESALVLYPYDSNMYESEEEDKEG